MPTTIANLPISAVAFGPLLIPVFVLGLLTSLFTMTWVVGRVAPRFGFDAHRTQRLVEISFVVGVVTARLGFVMINWQSYLEAPWTALYFWQPGYSVGIGFTAALVFAIWRVNQTNRLWCRQSILLLTSGLLTGATAFYVVIGLTWILSDRDPVSTDITIADFTLEDLDGNAVRWSDLGGQPTLINFWATWCPPCRREMPLLDLANQIYQSQGLNIVGISVGESKETVRRYIDSIGITYPIWVNAETDDKNQTQEIFDKYGGTGLPTTIFSDRQGVISKLYVGELSRGFIDSEVKKLLLQTN